MCRCTGVIHPQQRYPGEIGKDSAEADRLHAAKHVKSSCEQKVYALQFQAAVRVFIQCDKVAGNDC